MKLKKSVSILAVMIMVVSFVSINSSAYEKPDFLTIGTAGTGGAYYPIGISMAELFQNELDINTTAQVTGGAVENNSLIEKGDVDIAITQGPMAYAAVNGQDPYSQKHKNIKALFSGLSTGVFQMVVRQDSNINSIADLKEKKVSLGPSGGGAINVFRDILSAYDMTLDDIKMTFVSYQNSVDQLMDGKIDGAIVQAAPPSPAISQLSATNANFKILNLEEEKIKELLEKYPYYSEITLDEDVYGAEPATTIYLSNMVVINSELDDELVYEITKTIFNNIETIKNSHPAASGFNAEKALKVPIEFHLGAEKYLKDEGVLNE